MSLDSGPAWASDVFDFAPWAVGRTMSALAGSREKISQEVHEGARRDNEGQRGTFGDIWGQAKEGQTRTNRDKQGQTGTNRDKQRQTGTNRDKQRQTATKGDKMIHRTSFLSLVNPSETRRIKRNPSELFETVRNSSQHTQKAMQQRLDILRN